MHIAWLIAVAGAKLQLLHLALCSRTGLVSMGAQAELKWQADLGDWSWHFATRHSR